MHGDIFKTSFGWVGVAATERGISRIVLPKNDRNAVKQELYKASREKQRAEKTAPADSRIIAAAVTCLRRYFAGECVSFDQVLDLRYYTIFQQKVWRAAATIPYGETRSYASIAAMIGNPKAVRAVGQAMGANPIPLIIPCHRVISSAGTLGGFSGGVGMKKRLLELESHGPVKA